LLIDKPLKAEKLLEDDDSKKRVEDIINIINKLKSSNNEGAITISINGAWGVGKSSYLNAIKKKFEDNSSQVLLFEAWRYSDEPDIFLALLEELYTLLDSSSKKVLRSIIKSLGVVSLIGADTFLKSTLQTNIEDIQQKFKLIEEKVGEFTTKTHQNQQKLKKVLNKLAEDKPFVLLIDDLDRLVPQKAFNLLEKLRFYFEGDNIIIIMAINDEVINKFVHNNYNIENLSQINEAFIDKIFHYSYELSYSPYNSIHFESINNYDSTINLKKCIEELFNNLSIRLPHRKWINILNRIEVELSNATECDNKIIAILMLKELFSEFNYFYRKYENVLLEPSSEEMNRLKTEVKRDKELFEKLLQYLSSSREGL